MSIQELQQIKQRFHIIGNCDALNRAIEVATTVAATDLSVLITGESGVGKEHFPKIIHAYSARKHGSYMAVNCGAIPEGTIDAELFGHEKGAFTGAISDRKGYFEAANGGTLFLDEVGELPLSTQARLLRVLETGEFIRVGSSRVQKTDVRVVAATNLNMRDAIARGRFRADLYYRLNTVPIQVPPLRDRQDDIALLFRKFAADCADQYHQQPVRLTEAARATLSHYYWHGNIRQLKNITEQISVLETNREISAETLASYLPNEQIGQQPALLHQGEPAYSADQFQTLVSAVGALSQRLDDLTRQVRQLQAGAHTPSHIAPSQPVALPTIYQSHEEPSIDEHWIEVSGEDVTEQETTLTNDTPLKMADVERQRIEQELARCGGNRKKAAENLGISDRTIYRKLKSYGLQK